MIDFACKSFNLDEIIKCGLNLTKADIKVMRHLLKIDRWCTADTMAEHLGLNLSTVQRAVKKLYEKDLVTRTQDNLSGGGYIFQYRIKGKEHISGIIRKIIHKWVGKVEEALDKW